MFKHWYRFAAFDISMAVKGKGVSDIYILEKLKLVGRIHEMWTGVIFIIQRILSSTRLDYEEDIRNGMHRYKIG
jgi:hypothetical protein